MSELKKHRKGTKNYYLLPQVSQEQLEAKNHYQCRGCCFDDLIDRNRPACPERHKEFLACQEWGDTPDGGPSLIDYIYVPATRQGLTEYVIHKLEYA